MLKLRQLENACKILQTLPQFVCKIRCIPQKSSHTNGLRHRHAYSTRFCRFCHIYGQHKIAASRSSPVTWRTIVRIASERNGALMPRNTKISSRKKPSSDRSCSSSEQSFTVMRPTAHNTGLCRAGSDKSTVNSRGDEADENSRNTQRDRRNGQDRDSTKEKKESRRIPYDRK